MPVALKDVCEPEVVWLAADPPDNRHTPVNAPLLHEQDPVGLLLYAATAELKS